MSAPFIELYLKLWEIEALHFPSMTTRNEMIYWPSWEKQGSYVFKAKVIIRRGTGEWIVFPTVKKTYPPSVEIYKLAWVLMKAQLLKYYSKQTNCAFKKKAGDRATWNEINVNSRCKLSLEWCEIKLLSKLINLKSHFFD